ncbi:MAG: LysR family transcriptional regulator [Betaproteobacteria bacterium]|nr:LysR family transcriptional regulator [Betaproteobacteria bacterium]
MSKTRATNYELEVTSDLQKWRAFVAIGELGSLTRAAQFLNSNQSFLSRLVNSLERECGTRLFIRTGRGVELSEAGQRLFSQVKDLLTQAQTLEQHIRADLKEPTGLVTIGSLPSIGTILMRKLFSEVREKFPGIGLKILEGSSGQVEEWLNESRVDIAILYRYGLSLPEHEETLAVVDSYLIGCKGDRMTSKSQIQFKDLDNLPFILPSSPNGLRTTLDSVARQEGISLAPVIEADSLPLQKQLTEKERIFTVLPLHAVWQEINDGALQASQIVNPPIQRTVVMAHAKAKGPSRAVTTVSTLLVRLVEEMASQGMWRT